jgi:cobalamin biosynthesis protein CobC
MTGVFARRSPTALQDEAAAPAVYHGGDLGAARLQFPGAPTPWLDLSTGINAIPYPADTISPEALTRLPDEAALARLQGAAAKAYGATDSAFIVAAAGTQTIIQWLPKLVPARRVAVLGFGYQEYPAVWQGAGAEVAVTHDIAGLTEPGIDVAIVVNPNNPDARLVDPQALADIATRLARRGGLLIVDEAFMDVTRPSVSLVPTLPERGVVVLRSFGKAYGLAGLRLGFAVTGFDLADKLRAALGPWAVSGPATEIGAAALADTGWLTQSVTRLQQQAARLDALLTTAGFSIVGGTPLFRLARHQQAAHWFEALGRRGILTRPFPERRDWLRFGIPGIEADWTRLAEALQG